MIKHKNYVKELHTFLRNYDLSFLNNKSIMITGASGLIGSYLVDLLMMYNEVNSGNINVYSIVRNYERALNRFEDYITLDQFNLVRSDVSEKKEYDFKVDFIVHAASNANPKAFDEDPIGTIKANVDGTMNLLDYAHRVDAKLLYLSSSEIYGEPISRGIVYEEEDMGIIDPINPRSCYTESKRMAENICINYSLQFGVHTNIARIGFAYGSTFGDRDNRVIPQFIRSGLSSKNIVMKSTGSLVRSYIYMYDVASAIFTILNKAESREVYNIANSESNVSIKQIAEAVSKATNKEIKYDLPKQELEKGYAPFSSGLIDASKLEKLGWKAQYDIEEGINQIIKTLQD